VAILGAIGDFEMRTLGLAKDALKPFYVRDYLVDASDPAVRQAADTALVKRMGEVIRLGLRAALDASVPYVREEAVRGLKVLGDRSALDAVLARLAIETNWRVRAEAVEYLGRTGGADAVRALLPLLEDPDPTIRHKTRQALTRLAGRDLGFRRRTWQRWAEARHPELIQREVGTDEDADGPSRGP
jgi:HEAT repeat protein